jgi:S1-C subfamily serine protease
MGATFRQLSDDEKGKYNIDKGIVVTEPGSGSFAKQTQIIKGFVITGVNNTAVGTVADFQQLIVNARNVQISGFYPGQQGMYYYTLSNTE